MSTFKNLWDRLGEWLLLHWLTVLALALAFAFFMVLLAGKKSQDAGAAVEHGAVLSKKQVKAAEKVIKQANQEIATQTAINLVTTRERDSLVVRYYHSKAKSDSTIHALTHALPLPDTAAAPTRVYARLLRYRPRAVVLPSGDSLY